MKEELKHPYKGYERLRIWSLVEKAILDLEKNNDIEVNTKKEYIIGYLCESIKHELDFRPPGLAIENSKAAKKQKN